MKKVWEKRLKEEAVSPVIAVILMVAITVVLAAVLYVTVNEMMRIKGGPAPQGSLYVRESENEEGTYTATMISISDTVKYEDFYVAIDTDDGIIILGTTEDGLSGGNWNGNVLSVQLPGKSAWANYTSASEAPTTNTVLGAGDVLKLETTETNDPWDGAEIKYVYIASSGGLIASKIID